MYLDKIRSHSCLLYTSPLIDYYKAQGILKSVDGTKPMDEVMYGVIFSANTDIFRKMCIRDRTVPDYQNNWQTFH